MDKRISIVNIIMEDNQVSGTVNALVHEYSDYVIGRLGIPYSEKGVAVICIVMDAPTDVTSALSGKLGMISGVTAKTLTAKV
jgi:putative iron-only hydrogenase system regulator